MKRPATGAMKDRGGGPFAHQLSLTHTHFVRASPTQCPAFPHTPTHTHHQPFSSWHSPSLHMSIYSFILSISDIGREQTEERLWRARRPRQQDLCPWSMRMRRSVSSSSRSSYKHPKQLYHHNHYPRESPSPWMASTCPSAPPSSLRGSCTILPSGRFNIGRRSIVLSFPYSVHEFADTAWHSSGTNASNGSRIRSFGAAEGMGR